MMMGKSSSLVVFMLVLMIRSSLSSTKCKRHELEALLKFKHSFTRDPQRLLESWVGEDCCSWFGVGCDNVTSDVIKIKLRNSRAYGGDYTNSLVSSKLSSALLELKFLSLLDLSGNNFTGSRIPAFLGSMTKLRYLNFSRTIFSGPIPPKIGNLTNLIHLDLSDIGGGYFTLNTEERLEWASSLSNLKSLDMSFIDMSQAYDTLQVLFRLRSLLALTLRNFSLNNIHLSELFITNTFILHHLDLGLNNFEGPFPSFLKNIPSLRSLSLSRNSLSGYLPLWLSNMRRLKYLVLYRNKLNGSLPSQLGQLTNLNYLDLSNNDFHGPVPTPLAKLSALKYLDLSNNGLSGLIPDVLLEHLTEIEHLDISSNSIQATISRIGNLSRLSYLNMDFNNIKLNLSTNWRPPFQLQFLGVHSCELNTAFPQWLKNQTKIESLDLSYTGISGELPQWLWNITNLYYLSLAGNKLTGSLPRNINGCNLQWIDLQDNMLSGRIPYWLKHLKTIDLLNLSRNLLSGRFFEGENASSLLSTSNSLELLDLSDNMLSGGMQFTNEYLRASLRVLRLRRNYFSGLISSKLCNLTYLAVLDLAQNRFTGHIPTCLGYLRFNVSGYIDGTIEYQEIIKGTTENINGGTLSAHTTIDVSCNRLVGKIPEEFTNLTNLRQINLSNNHLTGGIPDDIGNLQLLESLDLSNNNLLGTIPQSLSDIPWLSFLNLSYNHLYGPIPTGSQLQTLDDPSIYAGNSELCGFPLPNKCSKPNSPPSPTDDNHGAEKDDGAKDKLDKLWLYLAIMSGVATGFWGVILTLVFKKSWRYAYFRSVEKVADRIYVPFKIRMNRFGRARTENSG